MAKVEVPKKKVRIQLMNDTKKTIHVIDYESDGVLVILARIKPGKSVYREVSMGTYQSLLKGTNNKSPPKPASLKRQCLNKVANMIDSEEDIKYLPIPATLKTELRDIHKLIVLLSKLPAD